MAFNLNNSITTEASDCLLQSYGGEGVTFNSEYTIFCYL